LGANRDADALAHFERANDEMPGWWLIEEHIAEANAQLGNTDRALAMYTDILKRSDDPEFMDAVARIYRDRGNAAEAALWIAKAKAGHAARIALFPEAAAGHAETHITHFGAIQL
jgi:tetratricopeptide (TPR) repeat protein